MVYSQKSLDLHRQARGKIELRSKVGLKNKEDMSAAYTPGVAAVCMEIARDKRNSSSMTNRGSQVAIVSDGTAILGLGDLGPEAAMPVMESKSIINNSKSCSPYRFFMTIRTAPPWLPLRQSSIPAALIIVV
jgi:malate dehydrogenase (oxaloacetate-decarboxylating)